MDNREYVGQRKSGLWLEINLKKEINLINLKKEKAGEWHQKRNPTRSDAELPFSAPALVFSGLICETQIIQPPP